MDSLLFLAALEVDLWLFMWTEVFSRLVFDQNQTFFVFGSATDQKLKFLNFSPS